jgi:hypothetical protein
MMLKFDDHGADVEQLQRQLARAGYPVAVTHVFDEATQAAVKALQAVRQLVVDGIAGPKTLIALRGTKDPKHLSDSDLAQAADKLGVPLAAVRAVNEVESRGSGFLPDGRPAILFERHVFWRQLAARKIDPVPLAGRAPNVLAQTPGGYQGGAAEYTRLASAELIDRQAAHEAASWGAFQIMGYHWKRLGYASINDFVARMRQSEAEHLDAFVRFIAADTGLLAALKAQKWAAFAKGYNGPNYARNLYDAKLAQAYAKYTQPHGFAANTEALNAPNMNQRAA